MVDRLHAMACRGFECSEVSTLYVQQCEQTTRTTRSQHSFLSTCYSKLTWGESTADGQATESDDENERGS
ncbi:hypothetical protein R1flu_016519 [Riccia fluitans]|uniref:Uncharacterized protein n=1 Tax=Riccia fluitans TaxID=41844 RepID=A0ABD1YM31_9MARC